jgi:hypothetical protein
MSKSQDRTYFSGDFAEDDSMDIGPDHTSAKAQALSVPPYVFALFVVLLTTWLSDRYRSRSVPLFILCATGGLGYVLLALSGILHKSLAKLPSEVAQIESPGGWWEDKIPASVFSNSRGTTVAMSYTGIILAVGSIFPIVSLVITWNGNNSETESGRGAGMALMQSIGQCGGPLLGVRLYPASHGPEYIFGSLACATCMATMCVLVLIQRWRLKRENRRRELQDAREVATESAGRRRRRFLYML